MDRALAGALALACLLVLAGCANPLGSDDTPTPTEPLAPGDTPTTAPGDESGATAPAATAATVTLATEDLPPGVSRDGIDDVSTLADAHTSALERTGFVAVGNGTSVVRRGGLLVEVESSQRNRVAANGSAYETSREVAAGPFQREVDTWSDGSVEFVRTIEGGETNYTERNPRPIGRLAGRVLLRPYLRGGDYEVREVRNGSDGRAVVVLGATEIANATALERAITDDAEEVTAYEAIAVVDRTGRIRSLEATVEYVIDGRTATQEFRYTLATVGGVEVQRPGWVDDARDDESRRADPDDDG